MFTSLQQIEVFHLAFLRLFIRRVKPNTYALKGGSNLRFFYNSIRYSEDMDLDIADIEVFRLKDTVMEILQSKALATTLKPFQIERVIPPDIKKAKQTDTVQKFKTHLVTFAGEDLFAKIEFSRRRLEPAIKMESVSATILYIYKQAPLLVCHYPPDVAIRQKIGALADRARPEARDVFDIFMLHTQLARADIKRIKSEFTPKKLKSAEDALFGITYEHFRDTVCNYLSDEDRKSYDRREVWEEMQIKVAEIISV